ncbi:hybrid sensor histidine kinase/response regulator [uncultured Methanoregula sp.]|uniref:hybrid sensor histidine kinase/response regulator n=1 Tax=uncultured Methanoregula sp. TaxID=1005933 RepID=UPI002AAB991D|nr:hybrid sensor histidine kinase/response regulator [uncultured Methanoregula sp.]
MSRGGISTRKHAKVLIAEDSRTQAEILKSILEKHGFVPVVAENGRQALDMLDSEKPDAIISDIVMPVMDGYEFCRAVKSDERYCHIPVILLTMLVDSKDIIYALVSGADNFITKPYQGDHLISHLKKVLADASHPAPEDIPGQPFDLIHSGKTFRISHSRQHIIELLLSAYEAAVIQHQEVLSGQKRLSEANDEANLYLDIITHDINNVNTGALALTELLLMKTADTHKSHAQRLVNCINQSTEIIGNVSTIRRLHEIKETIREIVLDDIIRNEIRRFSTNRIRYSGTKARVMADTLLGQVFANLVGNSTKFAGAKAEIFLQVVDHPDHVEVIVSDNGPGIPDDMKPVVFDRFRKGMNPKSGKGLGLFIARTLVENYGGKIWADDRIKGQPDKGAAIHFTLKKAG